MEVVSYNSKYARCVADLFHASVHAIDPAIYTRQQQAAWAPTPPDYGFWENRLEIKQPLIALIDNRVVGFIELENDGHIDCTYVHPDFQGRGVAKQLYTALEDKAKRLEITRLYVEASIVAKPFFQSMGFRLVKQNNVKRNGQMFINYTMEKFLTASDQNLH